MGAGRSFVGSCNRTLSVCIQSQPPTTTEHLRGDMEAGWKDSAIVSSSWRSNAPYGLLSSSFHIFPASCLANGHCAMTVVIKPVAAAQTHEQSNKQPIQQSQIDNERDTKCYVLCSSWLR